MREKLGESLASVQKYDAPAESVTTPSLEALQAYSLGYQRRYWREAITLPPFHCSSGPPAWTPTLLWPTRGWESSYANLGENTRAAENARKAYELRERVSEREKFFIASHYEFFVTGNLEAARKTYELWAQTYPRDGIPPGMLGGHLRQSWRLR